ncbi:NVEALA domain-containing protein [Phocaeicola faecalis]
MKKNILKATVVAAFALVAGFNVYNSQKSDVMSELALANVEALANIEGDTTDHYYCKSGGPYCDLYLNGQMVFQSRSHFPIGK